MPQRSQGHMRAKVAGATKWFSLHSLGGVPIVLLPALLVISLLGLGLLRELVPTGSLLHLHHVELATASAAVPAVSSSKFAVELKDNPLLLPEKPLRRRGSGGRYGGIPVPKPDKASARGSAPMTWPNGHFSMGNQCFTNQSCGR